MRINNEVLHVYETPSSSLGISCPLIPGSLPQQLVISGAQETVYCSASVLCTVGGGGGLPEQEATKSGMWRAQNAPTSYQSEYLLLLTSVLQFCNFNQNTIKQNKKIHCSFSADVRELQNNNYLSEKMYYLY